MSKRAAIATLLCIAEGDNDYVSFTCCEAQELGYGKDYTHWFSIKQDGKGFFLSDDPEYAGAGAGTDFSDSVKEARQAWRRTALCLAAAMIATGDLRAD